MTQSTDAPAAYPQAHNTVAQTAQRTTPAEKAEHPRHIAMLAPP